MAEEGGDFSLRIVNGPDSSKSVKRLEGFKESCSAVESPTGATSIRLVNNAVEELLRHEISHNDVVHTGGKRRDVAGAFSASCPAEIVTGTAESKPTAAQPCRAAAVLRRCSGDDSDQSHR